MPALLAGRGAGLRRTAVAVLVILVAACSSAPTPGPTVIPGASGAGTLGEPELRLRLVDVFGPRWYCDPDVYPVAVADELTRMRERWPVLLDDASTLAAILAHEDLPPLVQANLSDDERLRVYRLWKVVSSIPLELIGNGRYRFDYTAMPAAGATEGRRTAGFVDVSGTITIEADGAAGEPNCPI